MRRDYFFGTNGEENLTMRFGLCLFIAVTDAESLTNPRIVYFTRLGVIVETWG